MNARPTRLRMSGEPEAVRVLRGRAIWVVRPSRMGASVFLVESPGGEEVLREAVWHLFGARRLWGYPALDVVPEPVGGAHHLAGDEPEQAGVGGPMPAFG